MWGQLAMSKRTFWLIVFALAGIVEAITLHLWRDPDIARWFGATLMLGVLFGFAGMGPEALFRKLARREKSAAH